METAYSRLKFGAFDAKRYDWFSIRLGSRFRPKQQGGTAVSTTHLLHGIEPLRETMQGSSGVFFLLAAEEGGFFAFDDGSVERDL